ncbi:type VI secretion system secreted protein VgrG [Duganella sp. 3397]|uniref:type VI secretion system Vgr family protein n=1 Tax=Duganella sp. 3397 TaxID=2817732 RepID=UPI00286428AC|nr:type VI secretion system Vgr family protein [Duganella sp. 3397]MDR7049457.1 type VI secretion system secreted protein VgrG [Duganella sp. 3397]
MSTDPALALLTSSHRPLRLRLAFDEGIRDDLLLPHRISGTETVCGGIEYRVLCVATDALLSLKQFIAVPAELQLVTDRGDLHTVCGIVAAAYAGMSDGGLATYQLVLRDGLALMDQRTNTRIFRQQNELQIVATLLAEWRQTNPVMTATFQVEIDAALAQRPGPEREFTMQHNESDAQFVRRLLKRRGISWYVRPGVTDDEHPVHQLVLFDDAARLPASSAGTIRFHRNHATEQRDAVTVWTAARQLRAGAVMRFSWDYKRPHSVAFMQTNSAALADQGRHGNCFAATLADYLVETPHAGNDNDDLRQLGALRMARLDVETKCFHGESGVRDLRAGEWFILADHPEIDQHPQAERAFVVTALEVEARNNFPQALDARLDGLYAQSGWRAAAHAHGDRYRNRFTCVRKDVHLVPAYDPRTDVPNVRPQSAIVVGPAGEEVHCDALGRVKVRFPAARMQDHRDSAADDIHSAWIRVATSWAGAGPARQQAGSLTLPRVGSEVLIDFLGGDPDRPVIVGQLFNGVGVPPELGKGGGLPGNRYLSGMRSKEVRGKRKSQLRFDDTTGEISAQLASDHAASALNLGYLTAPRQAGSASKRGDGFELRTDGSGSLRTARSLLISAWQRLDGAGEQLDQQEHLALMQDCLELFKSLGSYAAQHQALATDAAGVAELQQQLSSASAAKPAEAATIAITAPDGIAVGTRKTLLHYAVGNIDQVAQQQLQFSAGKCCTINAGQGISLFAHQQGITQIAHHGKYRMQSQHDLMQLDAARDLRLTSATRIVGVAQDEITLMTQGGAYLKLSGGSVELGGPGTLTVKTNGHHWNGPASERGDLPTFGQGELGRTPRLVSPLDGAPCEGVQVSVATEDGKVVSGVTDADGKGPTITGDQLQQLTATFFIPRD